jgi:hypothetical protein
MTVGLSAQPGSDGYHTICDLIHVHSAAEPRLRKAVTFEVVGLKSNRRMAHVRSRNGAQVRVCLHETAFRFIDHQRLVLIPRATGVRSPASQTTLKLFSDSR